MKKKKNYNPISAAFSYTIGNMLITAIPFLTLPIFTRIMSTADYGLYNTYLSYENILTILLGCGLSGTIRVAKIEYKENFEDYISSIYFLQTLISVFSGILALIIFVFVKNLNWFDSKLLPILLLNCLASQIYNIASAKFAINGEVFKNLSISFALTIINVFGSFFLCKVIYPDQTYLGRILGSCLGFVVAACLIYILQLKISKNILGKNYWLFGLRMGAPLILHSLSLTLLAQCDKIMIQSIVGSSEAGIYSIAVTLSGIITVLVTSADNAWAPWFYSKLEEKQYNIVLKYNNYMIAFFTFTASGIMLIAPELVHLISSRDYWNSIYSFVPLLISVVFNFFYIIPVNFEYYHKKTGYIASSTIIVAIINIALNYIFIMTFGYIGAAYSTAISKFILLIMHWKKAWKLEQITLMGKKCILLCTIALVIIGALTLLFNAYWYIRYIILIAILASFVFAAKRTGMLSVIFSFIRKKINKR